MNLEKKNMENLADIIGCRYLSIVIILIESQVAMVLCKVEILPRFTQQKR